jgi:hypothetical protein
VISATEKIQIIFLKTRFFGRQKSVEEVLTLGPNTQATLVRL